MSVSRITAWQTSTGNAYASKSQACHEEMAWLIRTKGEAMKPTIDVNNFDNCIAQQKELISDIESMRSILEGKKDKKTLEDLEALLCRAEAWLVDAIGLKENMNNAD